MDPVEEAKKLVEQAKLQKAVPLWGTRDKLRNLQLETFKRNVADQEIKKQAAELNRITGLNEPEYAESLIKKYGSLSNALIALKDTTTQPQKDILGTLGNYILAGTPPRQDKPVIFLNDVIKESYPRYTETYQMSDRVADALREYIRLFKEYREDLSNLTRKLDRLADLLSTNMDIPRRELSPLVHTIVPLALQEPNFY